MYLILLQLLELIGLLVGGRMKFLKWKQNKGISMPDVVIAISILSLFVGVIGTLYYQIASYTAEIRANAMAVHYAVQIAESTDKMLYEQVNEKLNNSIDIDYSLPEGFSANIKVKKYNEDDATKQDIIKIVIITVNYEFLGQSKNYTIQKLKIKEA